MRASPSGNAATSSSTLLSLPLPKKDSHAPTVMCLLWSSAFSSFFSGVTICFRFFFSREEKEKKSEVDPCRSTRFTCFPRQHKTLPRALPLPLFSPAVALEGLQPRLLREGRWRKERGTRFASAWVFSCFKTAGDKLAKKKKRARQHKRQTLFLRARERHREELEASVHA